MGKVKPAKIHEFNPDIYPMLFWVCLNATYENLIDIFKFVPDNEGISEAIDNNAASASLVIRKSDKKHGVLVFTEKKSYVTGSIIAHESVHVADAFFQKLGMTAQTFDAGNEPYAYLVGWAAKCINNARITK